ncbi:nucleotide-binding protein [Sphingopyxis sp. H050]|jgi:RNase adapter protein RapZ|uniref:RNase adapter RapZ n=1 Tax=Sphingopyxis sp. H050 TaxID=1759072 RepID=UPI0007367D37|nr:RNase adapter RapZ [Sphingopyxis sp. H050]KTE21174.1 nucleotide-binding protein [Sphingopyxis sp. H050]
MSAAPADQRLLLVTGLSGAGKSTVLKVLEDLGWEVVDNLPLALLEALIDAPAKRSEAARPIAVGIDSRSRGFRPALLVKRIKELRDAGDRDIQTLFLDCAGAELERRFSETRRRHPMAEDRPAADGIAREREMMEPLRRWAEQVIDTTNYSSNDLQQEVRQRFGDTGDDEPVLNVLSFGFARGLPRNADLVFDMRYLRNPHWDPKLKPGTGLDADVAAYVMADPAYEDSVAQIEMLILTLLPRYRAEGKSYVTIAFGCTGGRHRSVHVADRVAQTLRASGYEPVLTHRNLDSAPQDGLEGRPPPASPAGAGKA